MQKNVCLLVCLGLLGWGAFARNSAGQAATSATKATQAGSTDPKAATASAQNAENDLPLPATEADLADCETALQPVRKGKGKNKKRKQERVKLTFSGETDIDDLLAGFQPLLCQNIIIASGVKSKTITFNTPVSIPRSAVKSFFLTALDAMELAIIKSGEMYKIVNSQQAKNMAPLVKDSTNTDDRWVTKFVQLRYADPSDLATMLGKSKERDADIVAIPASQALLISDRASNMPHWDELIRVLDKKPLQHQKLWSFQLSHTPAKTALTRIQDLLLAGSGSSGGSTTSGGSTNSGNASLKSSANGPISKVAIDDRSNAIYAIATKEGFLQIKSLLQDLEQTNARAPQIHSYKLKNVSAEEIVTALGGLGIAATLSTSSTNTAASGSSPSPVVNRSSQNRSTQTGPGGGAQNPLFQGDVRITAFDGTNSVLIVANEHDYQKVVDSIAAIDVYVPQIFMRATVLELSSTNNQDLGLSFSGALPLLGGVIGGGLNGGIANSVNPVGALSKSGLAGGLIGPTIPMTTMINGSSTTVSVPTFSIMLSASALNIKTSVLQDPFGLTTNNKPFLFKSGQDVAVLNGLTNSLGGTSAGTTLNPIASVNRMQALFTLQITPRISKGLTDREDLIHMDIDIDIEDILPNDTNPLLSNKSKRQIVNTATAAKDQTIVLGGIMLDKMTDTIDKVPLLGDIPILGYLFKTRSKKTEKRMLVFTITPTILSTPQDAQKIMNEYKGERQRFVETELLMRSKEPSSWKSVKSIGPLGEMLRFQSYLAEKRKNEAAAWDRQHRGVVAREVVESDAPAGSTEPQKE